MAVARIPLGLRSLDNELGPGVSPRGWGSISGSANHSWYLNYIFGRAPSTGTTIDSTQGVVTDPFDIINTVSSDQFYAFAFPGDVYGATINSATLRMSYSWGSWTDDNTSVDFNFVDRDGNDLGTTATINADASGKQVQSITLTGFIWDDIGAKLDGDSDQSLGHAILRNYSHTNSMAGDDPVLNVYAIWLEVDYDIPAAADEWPNFLGPKSQATLSGAGTTTDSITLVAGSSRKLIVAFGDDGPTSPGTPTYDGNNMTLVHEALDTADTGGRHIHIYYYDIPDGDTGSKDIVYPQAPSANYRGYAAVFERVATGDPVEEYVKTTTSNNTTLTLDRSATINGEGLGIAIGIGATLASDDTQPAGLYANYFSQLFYDDEAESNLFTRGGEDNFFFPHWDTPSTPDLGVFGFTLDDESLSGTDKVIGINTSSAETNWDFWIGWWPQAVLDIVVEVPVGSMTFTGYAPRAVENLDDKVIEVPGEALTLITFPPAALIGPRIDVPAGSLSLSGQAPSLLLGSGLTITFNPPVGYSHVDVSGLNTGFPSIATPGGAGIFPELANGDQIEWKDVTNGTSTAVTVTADSSFTTTATGETFDVRIWQPATGWSEWRQQSSEADIVIDVPTGALVIDTSTVIPCVLVGDAFDTSAGDTDFRDRDNWVTFYTRYQGGKSTNNDLSHPENAKFSRPRFNINVVSNEKVRVDSSSKLILSGNGFDFTQEYLDNTYAVNESNKNNPGGVFFALFQPQGFNTQGSHCLSAEFTPGVPSQYSKGATGEFFPFLELGLFGDPEQRYFLNQFQWQNETSFHYYRGQCFIRVQSGQTDSLTSPYFPRHPIRIQLRTYNWGGIAASYSTGLDNVPFDERSYADQKHRVDMTVTELNEGLGAPYAGTVRCVVTNLVTGRVIMDAEINGTDELVAFQGGDGDVGFPFFRGVSKRDLDRDLQAPGKNSEIQSGSRDMPWVIHEFAGGHGNVGTVIPVLDTELLLDTFAPEVILEFGPGAGAIPPTGELTLTGYPPIISGHEQGETRILTFAGSLALDTFAPSINIAVGGDILVDVPTGSLTLTGYPPTTPIIVPTAALTLTGLAPTVLTPRLVDVPTATMTLTGLAPTILTPRLVDVPVAALTLTGLAPTVLTPRLVDVPTGALTLTGLVPDALVTITVDVPTAAMALTGLVPTILTPRLVDVPTASLSLTGLVPDVFTPRLVDVPVGALTLAGLAPEALTPRLVDVPTAAITLTGLAPEVFTPRLVIVPTGTLTLAGLAPSVEIDVVVDVPTAAMTLTGLAPEISLSFLQDVPTGSLTLAGLVPDVFTPRTVDVPTGSLTLTGLAPDVLLPVLIDVPTKGGLEQQFSDNFNRANEDVSANSNWEDVIGPTNGQWQIASNQVTISTVAGSNEHGVGIPTSVQNYGETQAAECTIVSVGNGMGFLNSTTFGIATNMQDGTNKGIKFGWSRSSVDGDRLRLGGITGNTIAKNLSPALAAGDQLRVEYDSEAETAYGYVKYSGESDWTLELTYDAGAGSNVPDAGGQPGLYHNMGDLSVTAFGVIDDFVAFDEVGGLQLTGFAPTVLTPVAVDVPTAALTLTGQAPFVIPVVPTGSLVLTGQVPIILAGGNVTVEPPVATMTLTGLAPEVDLSWLQIIPVASMTLTGLAPEVFTPRTVDVPTGALTLTGLVPDVLADQDTVVEVPTGTLTLTGFAPVIDLTVDVPTGVLSLTGLAPEVGLSWLQEIPVGTLSLNGQVPTILTPRTVDVPTASLSLTGLEPTVLTPRNVEIPTGTLTLTGFAPTVFTPRTVDVPTGALSLAGLAPEIQVSITVDVPTGALTLAGQAPSLDLAVNVPVGALTLTGLQPFAITPQTIDVPTGSLTLTGLAPNVVSGSIIDVPTATLSLTGFAPSVELSWLQVIPVGSLSITGLVPVVQTSNNIAVDVPTASITLTGLPPNALTPRTVDVPTGTLSLTGFAPSVDISVAPITIPTGALVLSGLAPNPFVSADRIVEVPTGVLVLTGFSPSVESSFVDVPTAALVLQGLQPRVRFARDYGRQLTFKRVYNAAVAGDERVYVVPPDEEIVAR